MIAGRGARAHARAQLGDPRPTDSPRSDRGPVRAAGSHRGRRAGPCGGQCAPWSSRRGSGTEFRVIGGKRVPPGQGACQGDSAGLPRPRGPAQRAAPGAGGGGWGARDLVKCREKRPAPRGGGGVRGALRRGENPHRARGGVGWAWAPCPSRCPAPSSLSSFPPETLPAPAQGAELRAKFQAAAPRSALRAGGPHCCGAPSRAPAGARPWPGSRVQAEGPGRVRTPARPQQLLLPALRGRLSVTPAPPPEGSA